MVVCFSYCKAASLKLEVIKQWSTREIHKSIRTMLFRQTRNEARRSGKKKQNNIDRMLFFLQSFLVFFGIQMESW
jgi:hypothetical protein